MVIEKSAQIYPHDLVHVDRVIPVLHSQEVVFAVGPAKETKHPQSIEKSFDFEYAVKIWSIIDRQRVRGEGCLLDKVVQELAEVLRRSLRPVCGVATLGRLRLHFH